MASLHKNFKGTIVKAMAELISFVTRESQAAIRLYFEPLLWLLHRFMPRLKQPKENIPSPYIERDLGQASKHKINTKAGRPTIIPTKTKKQSRMRVSQWAAASMFSFALALCTERYIHWQISKYEAPAQELEKQAESIASMLADRIKPRERARMLFEVEPAGSDLQIEGGYNISTSPLANIGSSLQDYPSGKYLLSEAQNTPVLISAIRESTSNFLQQHPGSYAAQVEVIGSADSTPVLPGILYKGDLGVFQNFEYYSEDRNRFEKLDLLPGVTKLDNNSIAFLRAYNVLEHLTSLQDLASAKQQISTSTMVNNGGEYRKVIVRITIKNGLERNYSELSRPVRILVDHLQFIRDENSH
jgi:hypothetical protein